MSSKPSKIASETVNTSALGTREIIAVRVNAEDGSEAWVHGTVTKTGQVNTKQFTLPVGEYEVVREAVLFTLADQPEWLDAKHICEHEHSEHGQAGSWAFARLNKPGSPHDCQVCYGTPSWAMHCHTVKASDGMTCGERKAGWAAKAKAKADKEADDKAKAAQATAEAAAEVTPVTAPTARRTRKAAAETVAAQG